MDTYFELKIIGAKAVDEENITAFCFDYGCLGVSEDLDFKQTADNYEPETLAKEWTDLKAFFSERPAQEFFEVLKAHFPYLEINEAQKENKDWNEEFKKSIRPFALPGEVGVVPTWWQEATSFKHKIIIDPGMAFGTGTHETTQLACELLNALLPQQEVQSLLDVGTGSGILALYAGLKGVKNIEATEIESLAREVAKENCRRNGFTNILVHEDQIESLSQTYDVVIANIIDGVLIKLKQDLLRCTKEQGHLVLTGILQERDEYFRSQFFQANLEVIGREQKGPWIGYCLKKISGEL